MSKVILIDVDGTLVTYSNELPPSAAKAIQLARSAGHLVFLSTGRSKAEIPKELWDIGVDGLIGGNGAYAEYKGHEVIHHCLTREDVAQVVDWLRNRGLPYYLEANSGLYGSDGFEVEALDAIRAYVAGKGGANNQSVTVPDLIPNIIYGTDHYRGDVNKISFVLNSPDDHAESVRRFPHLNAGTWGGKGAHALFGDLGVSGIDKAHTIDILLDHLGVRQSETVAFGDAAVDVPMFNYCDVGVAMGNAPPEIQHAADLVTDSVDKDGLFNAFKCLGLLGADASL